MVTIYLDKQVFSYLFKSSNERYAALREKILSHKGEFIFCYSNAHLFDLQDDLTDTKYSEMDFMQFVVNGNHLIYKDGTINLTNNHPKDVFENLHDVGDFSWLDDIDFSTLTQEQIQVINNVADLSAKEFAGQLEFDWLKNRIPVSDDDLTIDKEGFKSLMDFVAYNFYQNKDSYKVLRDSINRESRGKVSFRNVSVDAQHSYFGSYCDCLVSDDDGVRRKSRSLYKLFNQATKVYSLDEFIQSFDEAIANNCKSTREHFDDIIDDYSRMKVLATESTPDYTVTSIETSHEYFGYFNCMFEMKKGGEVMIVLHRNNDIYRQLSSREIEILVNRISESFNSIGATWPYFNYQVEWPHLCDDTWGRTISMDDAVITLTKFKKLPLLELLIVLR